MYENRFGRFTAVDPLLASGKSANPQTFNRYVYVGNNPMFWVDPSGLIWGINNKNQVRWFNKDLGKGFSAFTPDNWQYQSNGRTVQLDENGPSANNRGWNFIDPVEIVAEYNPIQELAIGVTQGVEDRLTGMAKGIGNLPSTTLNGITGCIFNCGVQSNYFRGSNPFEVPLIFDYNNQTEEDYGFASGTGTMLGLGFAGGSVFGGASRLSVVPDKIGSVTSIGESGASLSTNGANLSKHLRQVEKYGQGGFKELQNGAFRYYGNIKAANRSGSIQGARFVREWNPNTGNVRNWMESLDQAGKVRIVHPKYNNLPHYMFDASGKYFRSF